METISIILPAKNESQSIAPLVEKIIGTIDNAEVLVINDGSTDDTAEVAENAGAHVISHPYSMGNGAAIKTGAHHAKGDILVFMDADGQHDPSDILSLLKKLEDGYQMVVGARSLKDHAGAHRLVANRLYNKLASLMTGHEIMDLTSGFRAVRAKHFRRFLYLLPNGFSYPTTSTMAFFRSGLPVVYVPIHTGRRSGKSKISLFKDGIRFLLIIIKIGSLFSPMRLFLPISFLLFLLGCGHYGYTFITQGRFTNMSALLLIASLMVFLIGILSEQISALHYRDSEGQR